MQQDVAGDPPSSLKQLAPPKPEGPHTKTELGLGAPENLEERLPRKFGRLTLLKPIARGGMGEVFLATAGGIEGAERPCVVKIIRREHAEDSSFLGAVLRRGAHPGAARPSGRGARARGRDGSGGQTVRRRRIRRRAQSRRGPKPRVAAALDDRLGRRGRHRRRALRSARPRARAHGFERRGARHRAPRLEPAERDAQLRRRAQAHRLRHRARRKSPLPHRGRHRVRQARLRRSRGRQQPTRRRRRGSVRARDHLVGARRRGSAS